MSIRCPDCGAVAGYGSELAHKSNCASLDRGAAKSSDAFPQSENAVRNLIAREIWRYQECPWNFDKPDNMMGDLQKQIAIDQAEGIRKMLLGSPLARAYFVHASAHKADLYANPDT